MSEFIFIVLNGILGFMLFAIFAYVILSWLIGFNIINTRNPAVYQLWRACEMIVNPILQPFRMILPNMGGLDLSPFLAALIIGAVRTALLPKAMMALQQLIG